MNDYSLRKSIYLFVVLAGLLATTATGKSWNKAKDAVQLSNVRALTLRAGKQTSHRRIAAIPQIKCIGGNACDLYEVDVMRCKNSGSEYDAEDIQWTCQASLPDDFKLGGTEVVCEGYDSPDDPYILKGSCGVEYKLWLTKEGEEKHGRRTPFSISNSLWTLLFWGSFIAVACVILYRVFVSDGPNTQRPSIPRTGGGGGGSGFDDDDDAPPPYSPRPSSWNRKSTYSSTSQNYRSSDQSWRPGFWSGAAAGGAAGYFMGNRNASSSRHEYDRPRQTTYGAGPSWSYGGGSNGGSLWGSGGSSSDTQPGPSSTRHTSTGFGGTRRR